MFDKGEYVVAGNNGICKIKEITHIAMTGANKEKLYYVLVPVENEDRTIYSPVDSTKVVMRNVLTKDEAEEFISEISDIDEMEEENYSFKEEEYKEMMKTCDCRQWVKLIKTLYIRKKKRIAGGKKATVTEEKYLRQAEDRLYAELAFAIGKSKSEIPGYISAKIGKEKAK